MIEYILVVFLILVGVLFIKNKYSINFWFSISFLSLFFISAFRVGIGADYYHFEDIFYESGNVKDLYVEFGYEQFMIIIKNSLKLNSQWVFIITSFFFLFSIYNFIDKYQNKYYKLLSLYLFVTTGVFFASLNLIRQYVAFSIIIIGTKYIVNRNYMKYFICIILAMFFHKSSIIALANIIIMRILYKSNIKLLVIGLLLSYVFMIIDIRFLFKLLALLIPQSYLDSIPYLGYLNSDYFNIKNTSAIIKQIIPNILIWISILCFPKLKSLNSKIDFFISDFYLNVIITNCFFGILVLVRLANYFEIGQLIAIPLIIQLGKSNFDKYIIKWCIILYYFILTVITIFIMNGHGVVPYKNILY